jgi:hypothetical protein
MNLASQALILPHSARIFPTQSPGIRAFSPEIR